MWEFLRHPLTIAAIGVAITGLVAPSIARRWQSHQKDLEVRVELVTEMSERVMDLITRIQAANALTRLPSLQDDDADERVGQARNGLDAERQRFEIREAVIGTKLQAYFPKTNIPGRWSELARALRELAQAEGSQNHKDAAQRRVEAAQRRAEQLKELLDQKAVLITDVVEQPSTLRMSRISRRLAVVWIPRRLRN